MILPVGPLLARVVRYANRHDMWRSDTRVIAAVSGGSDSVSLLLLLHELHARGALVLDAIAHLNHRLRPESDADEAFCAEFAQRLAIPFVAARVDIRHAAKAHRQSMEVAARHARRKFLSDVLEARHASCAALAHTRDDQAETVLLRLLRGTGLRGLAAMAPNRDRRVRPLLEVSRQQLRQELTDRGETWREDATNADLSHPRNRIRHELLPYLETHFNPSTRSALARAADLARADDNLLARQADETAAALIVKDGAEVRLDADMLSAIPEAIARRVVHQALTSADTSRAARWQDVHAVLDVAAGARPAVDLPNLRAEHSGGFVVLVQQGRAQTTAPPFCAELRAPGVVEMPGAGWSLEARCSSAADRATTRRPGRQGTDAGFRPATKAEAGAEAEAGAGADVAIIDADLVGAPLMVRSRRPGDRVRPLGLNGSVKLQDLFVDRKVERAQRDRVPIVLDRHGRIVWVVGHVIGEEFRVTDRTKAVLILKFTRTGAPRSAARLRVPVSGRRAS